MIRTIRCAALVAATTSLLVGCGAAAEKVSEKATEKMVEQQTGGNVDIDTDGDGSVEIETEDGSMSFGTGEVPEEWPDDIDLPDDLEVQSGTTSDSSDGRLVALVGATDETPEELLARYKDELADWEISGESTSSGGGSTLTGAQWETDGRRVTFAATDGQTPAGDATFLTISHTTPS